MEEPEGRYLELPNPRGVGGGLKSPGLKSAMKSPGAAPRNLEAMLSPTFKEEQILEKTELDTDKEQAHDLVGRLEQLHNTDVWLTSYAEIQEACADSKVYHARSQLLM
jgi:hypothetical protein